GGGGAVALRVAVTGGMIGSLFVRSFERAERISLAMAARGYRGGPLPGERGRLSPSDWSFAAGFALLLAGVWLWP
ncbi:MAG TPA: energy-coupling factor transporter transmembrane component T, partial [Armatimonadota bacterium]|nr:energy-coupling factor transporter transmembrane component T [Armatimonadota bacterium]